MSENVLCMSVQEMAQSLGLGRSAAYKLLRDPGFYPARRVGGRVLIVRSLLERWLCEQPDHQEVD